MLCRTVRADAGPEAPVLGLYEHPFPREVSLLRNLRDAVDEQEPTRTMTVSQTWVSPRLCLSCSVRHRHADDGFEANSSSQGRRWEDPTCSRCFSARFTFFASTRTVAMAPPAALSASSSPVQDQAEGIVQQLRQLPTPLPATARSDGTVDSNEQLRRKLYGQLRQLGPDALPALARGLRYPDIQLRRNVALALNVLAGNWFDRSKERTAFALLCPH